MVLMELRFELVMHKNPQKTLIIVKFDGGLPNVRLSCHALDDVKSLLVILTICK